MLNGLGLGALRAYDSSESDSSNDGVVSAANQHCDRARPRPKHTRSVNNANTSTTRAVSEHLPLPQELMSMFVDHDDDVDGKAAANHQGRIRSFVHEAGNWASYVYVPIIVTNEFEELVTALLNCLPPAICMQSMADVHLSVSRTVTLKYHWIRPFVESITNRLTTLQTFVCAFGRPHIYVNDECTRSFLSLTIGQGIQELKDIVKEVDLALNEFELPSFYEPASFHVSIGWTLGDISHHFSKKVQDDLQHCFREHASSTTSAWKVDKVCSKIGNKYFSFPLS